MSSRNTLKQARSGAVRETVNIRKLVVDRAIILGIGSRD